MSDGHAAMRTREALTAHGNGSPVVWGVVNVTPDSFSDGGHYLPHDAAIARGLELVAQGAHVIDVGGESTRPGATPVTGETERARVIPVITALAAAGVLVSIDTIHAETARHALAAGAQIVNDVSGGLADSNMYAVIRDSGALIVLGHWRGIPDVAHAQSHYSDVVAEVRAHLDGLADSAQQYGVLASQILLDPGVGFDKTAAQGWQIMAQLDAITELGYPVLVGVSRKRMLTELLHTLPEAAAAPASAASADARDLATAVTSAALAERGAWGVRVHDVPSTVQALAVAAAMRAGAGSVRPATDRPADAEPVDRITLSGLEVFAHHGVFEFERAQGQRFVIDAELSVALGGAARTDDLARTVHYGELAEAIVVAVERDPVDLIETVAERIAATALGFAGVAAATITVHKPDAPIDAVFRDVSVTVTRVASGVPR